MIVSEILLQILLPIVLLWWLIYGPKAGFIGVAIQLFSTGLFILALGLASFWLIIPRWVVVIYGLIWITAFVIEIRRLDISQRWPSQPRAIVGLILVGLLGVVSAYVVWDSTKARQSSTEIENRNEPSN